MNFWFHRIKPNVSADPTPISSPPAQSDIFSLGSHVDLSQGSPALSYLVYPKILDGSGVEVSGSSLTLTVHVLDGLNNNWVQIESFSVATGNAKLGTVRLAECKLFFAVSNVVGLGLRKSIFSQQSSQRKCCCRSLVSA